MSIPFGRSFVILRQVAGQYADGFWVQGKVLEFQGYGSCQPANPNELLTLPEGNRTKETVKIYTTSKLVTDDDQRGTTADRILIGDRRLKIVSEMNYTDLNGLGFANSHNRYLAQNDNEQTNLNILQVQETP